MCHNMVTGCDKYGYWGMPDQCVEPQGASKFLTLRIILHLLYICMVPSARARPLFPHKPTQEMSQPETSTRDVPPILTCAPIRTAAAFGHWASMFFIVYIFLSSMMILNLFIGVITNSIQDAKSEVRATRNRRRTCLHANPSHAHVHARPLGTVGRGERAVRARCHEGGAEPNTKYQQKNRAPVQANYMLDLRHSQARPPHTV